MPLVFAGAKRLFFAHVPKAGGTSVEHYLHRRFGHLALADRRRCYSRGGTGLIVPPNHLAVDDLEEFLPPELDYAFAVVRHPMDRILSEYRYQRGSSTLSRFSFSTWLRIMIECVKREPRMYENHIRPQSDLVPAFADAFKLENGCGEIIQKIDDLLGSSAPDLDIPHLNESRKTNVKLTREDVLAVRDFYSVDYARFSYAFRFDVESLPHDHLARWRKLFARVIAPLVVRKHKSGWVL